MAAYIGPVIDTHHHIWLRKDIPWLADPPIPRMYRRIFRPAPRLPGAGMDERRHAGGSEQVGARHRHVGRAARARRDALAAIDRRQARLSARHRLPGRHDRSRSRHEAEGADAVPQFARRAPSLHWDSHPLRQPNPTPDLCNSPASAAASRCLEKYGLHFELQVFAGQAKYAVELIRAFPHVPMILLHSGMLTERSPLMIEQWRAALTAMAEFPNVRVKLSGLGMFNQGITVPQARQVIRDSIQIFGIDRTIYGSNFPLEKLHASYADFFAVYRKVMSEYTEAEQRKVFHDNAVMFYRL